MTASTDIARAATLASPAPAAARWPVVWVREHGLFAVIVLALVYLALLPLFTSSLTGTYLAEIAQHVDPARAAATDVQLALSLEAANTRAFLLTGESVYSASFRAAREDRRAAMRRLLAAAEAVDPDVQRLTEEVSRQLEPADVLLTRLHTGQTPRDEYSKTLPLQHARFTETARTMADLKKAIDRAASARRERIRRIHVVGLVLTGAGLLLAIVALMALARLSRARRDLAERERHARAIVEQAHADAERRREALDALRASRHRLIRGFSHDLKNPLGAADGYLFMLEQGVRGPLTDAQADCVMRSRRALQGAMHLIEDLVELARTERADINVRPERVDLRDVAARVLEDYRAQAEAKGLTVSSQMPADPVEVRSDPGRVAQVLGNLLSNAIKYTDSGLVGVSVDRRPDYQGRACGVVLVMDTGPGIPPEHQDRIFDEFQRFSGTDPRAGAGIGLAISQRIAELLDGRLTVASAPRSGSVFTLWLPLAHKVAPRGRPGTPPAAPLEPPGGAA